MKLRQLESALGQIQQFDQPKARAAYPCLDEALMLVPFDGWSHDI